MTPQEKEKMDIQARLHQMKINTRLTALQSAQTLMATEGYRALQSAQTLMVTEGCRDAQLGKVDHITLLAMAQDIEKYILGDLEKEAQEFLDAAGKPASNIIKVRP